MKVFFGLLLLLISALQADPLERFAKPLNLPKETIVKEYQRLKTGSDLNALLPYAAWLIHNHASFPKQEFLQILLREKQIALSILVSHHYQIPYPGDIPEKTQVLHAWFIAWYSLIHEKKPDPLAWRLDGRNPYLLIEALLSSQKTDAARTILGVIPKDNFGFWHFFEHRLKSNAKVFGRLNRDLVYQPLLLQTSQIPFEWLQAAFPLKPVSIVENALEIQTLDHASHLIVEILTRYLRDIWLKTSELDLRLRPLKITCALEFPQWMTYYDREEAELLVPKDFWLGNSERIFQILAQKFALHQMAQTMPHIPGPVLEAGSHYFAKIPSNFHGSSNRHPLWPLSRHALLKLTPPIEDELVYQCREDLLTELGKFLFDPLPGKSVLQKIQELEDADTMDRSLRAFYKTF